MVTDPQTVDITGVASLKWLPVTFLKKVTDRRCCLMYININERDYQNYKDILEIEIPFKENYQESIRDYFDHYVRFNCMDYNDGMDFIARKFKNEEFEEYSNTETYKVLDKNVRCLHHGRQSSNDHRRKVREVSRKIREERKRQATSLKIRSMINGIR